MTDKQVYVLVEITTKDGQEGKKQILHIKKVAENYGLKLVVIGESQLNMKS